MKDIETYRKAGQDLYHMLHLPTYPIAIKYIKDLAEIPDKVRRPSMTSEDNFCVPSTVVHRWEKVPTELLIESQRRQGWRKSYDADPQDPSSQDLFSEDFFKKVADHIGFICSPLTETVVIPDSILVYGSGADVTHIIQSLNYQSQYPVVSTFTGFGESCQKGGLLPYVTQKPQLVLPGTGDRTFSGTSEHEIAIGMPADLVFYTVENMFKTGGRQNMGQPVKTLLPQSITESLTPGFDYLRKAIKEYKKKK
ncbi:MAG: DUF169 domain-containing protein [Deltaproteobacteria bacterium]|nr:DUF169 domain-containing protein [Deltaproteobacteria bacterium]